MTGPDRWVDRPLAEFARAAAARGPVPGSGSVAAAVGALGAGLASMALDSARGEGGSPGLASTELARRTGLARHMEALLATVDKDVEAYARYLEARAGRGALGPAVEGSIAVPLEMAEHALAALEELAEGVCRVRTRLRSEALTAAQALFACVEGATFTASSNLPGLTEPHRSDEHRRTIDARRARAAELVRAIRGGVGDDPR